ncbi:RAVE subunit 2/Rogdi [Exophiala viscosa]|uniref:RAVE subunit 2/Rogdi n=1 Tax=Exophiala viscosa TaxID=2486360 RepID=A0AAN6DQC2_9EURO|nr:RAVE subunit 2/Rogdi [Exophiala viscosa]KAI1628592.1 RAVE subunit 2/Rogdi [Exophiala viscosa]
MSTWVYPPIPPDELRKAEEESLKLELQWLLKSLQHSLGPLKEGLEECAALLAAKEPGSTLVLSSLRSESVKGFVTRVGTKLVKGDVHLRLLTLPPNTPRGTTTSTPSTRLIFHSSSSSSSDILLPQLQSVKSLINDSLDIIDVSRWTGQSTDSSFMEGQMKLLHDHLRDAKAYLRGPVTGAEFGSIPGAEWWTNSADESVFQPPLGDRLSLHFTIQDANLVLTIRTLTPTSPGGTPSSVPDNSFSLSGFNLRGKLLGLGPKPPNHDEMGEIFEWRGKQDVIVREKVRVESGDPSLMSIAAKLSALEHEVARWRMNLRIILTGSVEED